MKNSGDCDRGSFEPGEDDGAEDVGRYTIVRAEILTLTSSVQVFQSR